MITTNPSDTILIGGKYEALLDLYSQVKPDIYIEIGCYRLNTSVNLMKNNAPKRAYLLDLFEKAPHFETPPEVPPLTIDEAVSVIDANFPSNQEIKLVKGNTNQTLPAVLADIKDVNQSVFVFLDGGHSYQTTFSDLINVSQLKNNTVIVVDDADWPGISAAVNNFLGQLSTRVSDFKFIKRNLCYIVLNKVFDGSVKNDLIQIIQESNSILDIGANIGQSYVEYKRLNPKASILSIEANPNCEAKLKECQANYMIVALGDKNEEKNFFINKQEPTCQGASFFKERTDFYSEPNLSVKKINIQRLDDIAKDMSFDFIKIDTQGSELPIINGGVETIKKAKWLLIETPVIEYNEGSATFEQLESRLNDLGFEKQFIAKENFFGNILVQKDIVFKNINLS